MHAQDAPGQPRTVSEYVQKIKHYRYLDPDSALLVVKAGLKKSLRDGDLLGQAALLNQLGMIQDNMASYDQSAKNYLKAQEIYTKLGNQKGLASTLIRLGVVEKRKGNYDRSLAYYLRALSLSEKNHDQLGILEARVVLSEAYFSLDELNNCLLNLKIAEKIDSQFPMSHLSLNIYVSYGYFFIRTNQLDKAIDYINLGLSKSNKVEYSGSGVSLLKILGNAYIKKGEMSKGTSSLKQGLALARKIKNVMREQTLLYELSKAYSKSQPDSSIKYLEQALWIADAHRMYPQQIAALNDLAKIYKLRENFKKALELSEWSYLLSQKVYDKDMNSQISYLQNAYKLEKSNAQLNALKVKNNKETNLNTIILSITIGVSLVLGITLFYFYRARHLNRQFRQANDRLEASNTEKDRFFSILAHDIRSPLASTVVVLKFIANKELDQQSQDDAVNKLVLHCQSSLEVLDKLLKWGQMQIKGTKINITEFDPLVNINTNMALLNDAAERKNLDVSLDVPSHIVVRADSDHFDFIIRNLLANAIKFTPENGLISLSVKIRPQGLLAFKVLDNGVGISEKRIKKLFELSALGTKGTSDEMGFSLGLLMCKQFIEANSGTLEVESELGKGTSFTFSLPGSQTQPDQQ